MDSAFPLHAPGIFAFNVCVVTMPNYAFIDSQNVHLSIRDQGWSLNWKRFRQYLKDKYNVSRAFTFIGYVPGNEWLYTTLQEAGFILVFKPTLQIRSGNRTVIKGNVDAELVLHTMIEWNNFDRAVIVTGDGDFYCLVRYLAQNNKLHRLLIPDKRKYSRLLREFAHFTAYLNRIEEKIDT